MLTETVQRLLCPALDIRLVSSTWVERAGSAAVVGRDAARHGRGAQRPRCEASAWPGGCRSDARSVALDDAGGEVVRPCILWNDGRTKREVAYLNEVAGRERLVSLIGNLSFAGLTAPKLLWRNSPRPVRHQFGYLGHGFIPKRFVLSGAGRLHSFCHANGAHHFMGRILPTASCAAWFMDEVIRETDYGRSQRSTLVQFEPAPHCSYHIQTVCARRPRSRHVGAPQRHVAWTVLRDGRGKETLCA